MGRGWKIACGLALALLAVLALNALIVDADTEGAAVTLPDGKILELPAGDVQAVDLGPRDGEPIVLVHCFSCAIDYWEEMIPILATEHRVVAVDLRGHGGSEKPSSGYEVPAQAELVGQAMRQLGVSGATIVGHSLGGAVAVALAEDAPALANRVAIIGMPPDNSYGSLGFIAGLAFQPVIGQALWTIKPDFAVRQGLAVAFAPGFEVPQAFVDDVNRLTYTAYDQSPTHAEDYLDQRSLDRRIRDAAKPLLVLIGAEEQIIDQPRRALRQYEATVPWSQTHLIRGAGHSPNVEKPAQSARLVREFANSP